MYRPATKAELAQMTDWQRYHYEDHKNISPHGHVPICLMKDGSIHAAGCESGSRFAMNTVARLAPKEWIEDHIPRFIESGVQYSLEAPDEQLG